jgi:hypothetical protein
MTEEKVSLPRLPALALKKSRGQTWAPESALEEAGYRGYLGEIVRVTSLYGSQGFYELAALVPPQKAGIVSTTELVWWLVPVEARVSDAELASAVENERGGNR